MALKGLLLEATVRVTLSLSKGASLVAFTSWFDKLTMTFVHYAGGYKQALLKVIREEPCGRDHRV